MHKFERKFNVLGKGEKFLSWVPFRHPLEAPGRFQIQREGTGKEKARDGRALTNSFMKGLSGLLHKEQHHVFTAWVCIKQSFWRALRDHRIMKGGKDFQDLQVQPSSTSSVPRGCFFPFPLFYLLAHLPWDSMSVMDHISRDVCFFRAWLLWGEVIWYVDNTEMKPQFLVR